MNLKAEIARRPFLAGIVGVLGIGAVGGLVYEIPRLLQRRYKPTKYDDLLYQIEDRESAVKLGQAVRSQLDASPESRLPKAGAIAGELRKGPARGSVPRATDADIAAGRLVTVHGWLIPRTVALVCAIAADVQQSP